MKGKKKYFIISFIVYAIIAVFNFFLVNSWIGLTAFVILLFIWLPIIFSDWSIKRLLFLICFFCIPIIYVWSIHLSIAFEGYNIAKTIYLYKMKNGEYPRFLSQLHPENDQRADNMSKLGWYYRRHEGFILSHYTAGYKASIHYRENGNEGKWSMNEEGTKRYFFMLSPRKVMVK